MDQQTDRTNWRARTLEELYEHPDILEGAWIEGLSDADLERIVANLDHPEQLAALLDELGPGPDDR